MLGKLETTKRNLVVSVWNDAKAGEQALSRSKQSRSWGQHVTRSEAWRASGSWTSSLLPLACRGCVLSIGISWFTQKSSRTGKKVQNQETIEIQPFFFFCVVTKMGNEVTPSGSSLLNERRTNIKMNFKFQGEKTLTSNPLLWPLRVLIELT